MSYFKNMQVCFIFCAMIVSIPAFVCGQAAKPMVGAYYFDGWSGTTFHITDDLKNKFPEREPKWGWVTSSQRVVDEQIAEAADAGLAFFSFCWYFRKGKSPDEIPTNRALGFFKQSPNAHRLQYCLLVANHQGSEIGPDEWEEATRIWTNEFLQPQHLKVDGKPLIIFFENASLLRKFGSKEAVKAAFDDFRAYAVTKGLPGVTIAICAGSPDGVKTAEECGADVVTGYNYHSAGFEAGPLAIPIEKMQVAEQKLWGALGEAASVPYIPVSTIGWDPRPWANDSNNYLEKPYFTGFSPASVKVSVQGLVHWITDHPNECAKERIGLLYAWNENGEGSWLTPGKNGLNPLEGVKKALK